MEMPFILVQANPRRITEVITSTFSGASSPLIIQIKVSYDGLTVKGKSGKLQYQTGVIEIKPTINTEQSKVGTPVIFMDFVKSALRSQGISFF